MYRLATKCTTKNELSRHALENDRNAHNCVYGTQVGVGSSTMTQRRDQRRTLQAFRRHSSVVMLEWIQWVRYKLKG